MSNFCVHCGRKTSLGDRYFGIQLLQQGVKGRTILGIDKGTSPASYCIIKQAIITKSVLPQEFLAEFRQNLQQLRKLGDRREFPTVLDAFLPDNLQDLSVLPTVIFEKIEGESLLQKFNASGRFTESDVKIFLLQILPLIQLIHDHQIIHRDLSPKKLIFTPDQFWSIVDFTAAKVTSKMANVQPGTLVGSGIYTAPEQLRGKSYPASDLYSLGVICLELLTMMHPFELYSSISGQWVWRDYLTTPLSDNFADLLDKLVADRIGDRPRSANAVLELLGVKIKQPKVKRAAAKGKIIVVPETNPKKPEPPPKKKEPEWHCFKTFKGHKGYITALDFDSNGIFLASASADQSIRVWDVENRWEKKCLRGHKNIITAALFNGNQLISGCWDYTIRFWDWQQEIEGDRIEGKQNWIIDLALLDNGRKLASLGADQQITIWDLATKKSIESWDSEGSIYLDSDTKSQVLATANNSEIMLWESGRILCKFSGHFAKISNLKISPNGKFLISSAEDNSLMVWSVQKQQCDKVYQTENPVQAIAIFPNKRFFATGDSQGILQIYQLGQEQPLATVSGHEGGIKAIALSPNSEIIATGSQDKTIKLWRFGLQ